MAEDGAESQKANQAAPHTPAPAERGGHDAHELAISLDTAHPMGKEEIEMAPVRLSLPSKVMGACWFVLFYLFLADGPMSYSVIGMTVVAWGGWEFHWRRIWARQHDEATVLFDKLREVQANRGAGAGAQLEAVRSLQQLAWQVASSTTQTPVRCFVESLIVLAGPAAPFAMPQLS